MPRVRPLPASLEPVLADPGPLLRERGRTPPALAAVALVASEGACVSPAPAAMKASSCMARARLPDLGRSAGADPLHRRQNTFRAKTWSLQPGQIQSPGPTRGRCS